ncbi:hypothetical protein [Mesorhizobium sp.]|uniref:hypothetical protein n=1 Tax=Mesorhizobium sp. TaxID=1871066 RepID=UPI0025BBBC93|nr:hypothetical protein [Mesorhizobium sp.]
MSIVFDLLSEFFWVRDQSVLNGMQQVSDSECVCIHADAFNKDGKLRLRDKRDQRTGMPDTTSKKGRSIWIMPA